MPLDDCVPTRSGFSRPRDSVLACFPAMNHQFLLNIYEKIEALVSRLPGPLQSAVLNELRPIKQIFIAQRPARVALLGHPSANASALLSSLLGSQLKLINANPSTCWVRYAHNWTRGLRH